MTTYAKYADMYRQRLARSQDARLEMSGHVSPVRCHSVAKGSSIVNQTSLTSVAAAPQAPLMIVGQMQSPNSLGGRKRRSLGNNEIPSHVKMTQDRAAYMTFLEVQLERVTQACTNALSFQDKVEALSTQMHGQDEKVMNIGRLVKLLQSYSETQEEEQQTVKLQVRNLGMRIEEVSQFTIRAHEQQIADIHVVHQGSAADLHHDSGAFGTLTGHHTSSMSPGRSVKKSHSKSRSPPRRSDAKQQLTSTMNKRVAKLESQLKSMHSMNHFQTNSFGTLDQATVAKGTEGTKQSQPNLTQMKEDLNNFAQEVDRQMRDVEARVVTNLTQHFEETNFHTNSKIDEALLLLDQKVTRVEQLTSASQSRSNVIHSTQIIEDGRINPAKMEAALNDWLSKVEEQVNQIEDKVNDRAALIDLKSLERRVMDQTEEREVRFGQLEQYCQRMVEEGHSRYEDVQNLSLDWEDRFLQIQRQIESSLQDQSRVLAFEGGKGSLLQSGLTSLNEGTPSKDLTSLRTLEKKLARRLGEGVERLGDIIKDLAKAQRRLDTRANNLELKVFGHVRNLAPQAESKKTKKVADKGRESLVQSARGGSKKTTIATQAAAKPQKNSVNLKNSQSVKSPSFKQANVRRISQQKSYSPPVKDGSQGPVDRRASSNKRRQKSQKSIQARSKGTISELEERSISARNHETQGGGSLNVFKTSFEQRLMQDGEPVSPREILRRARDRSIRELSQSLNGSCSRSPNSHRLQSLVDIETASPNQHRMSQRHNNQDSASATRRSQDQSTILHGPASGQKNIIAQNMTQNFPIVANEFELDQFRQRQSGSNTGREYLTHQASNNNNDAYSTEAIDQQRGKVKAQNRIKRIKTSATRSNKSRKAASKENRSASKERSRDSKGKYTLQDLERREKSLQRKLGIKKDSTKTKDSQGRDISANKRGRSNLVANQKKDRSLSQRTFAKMNALGQNTLIAVARGSNATNAVRSSAHDVSYGSHNQSFLKRAGARKQSTSRDNSRTLSPSRNAAQMKTTKSMVVNQGGFKDQHHYSAQRPRGQQRSASVKSNRGRSKSAHAINEPAEQARYKNSLATAGGIPSSSARGHVTAAHEIFHQPFDYQQTSTSQLGGLNSRHSSNQPPFNSTSMDHQGANLNMTRQSNKNSAAKRKRSISMEHSREEAKNISAFSKKRSSASRQGPSQQQQQQQQQLSGQKKGEGAAGKTAKQKLKNLQNKKSNQRLAKLEKMYQELTDIEAKTAHKV